MSQELNELCNSNLDNSNRGILIVLPEVFKSDVKLFLSQMYLILTRVLITRFESKDKDDVYLGQAKFFVYFFSSANPLLL